MLQYFHVVRLLAVRRGCKHVLIAIQAVSVLLASVNENVTRLKAYETAPYELQEVGVLVHKK